MSQRIRYRSCKVCGATYPFVSISSRGLCVEHGRMKMAANVEAMVKRSGPNFRKWRAAMAASVGGELLDAQRERS